MVRKYRRTMDVHCLFCKVKKVKDYDMTRGIAYLYNEGDLHSPSRTATTRLIRVEGQDLTGVKRDKYEAVA